MSQMIKQTLVITWTLQPNTRLSVNLHDVWERTVAHMEGLLAWLQVPEITNIVIAKNCEQPINKEVLFGLAKGQEKQLELVQASSPRQVMTRGKGYGEGALMRDVLSQSLILRSEDSFFKVTGKLFAPEFLELHHASAQAGFYRMPRAIQPLVFMPRLIFRSSLGVNLLHKLRHYFKFPWNAVAYKNDRQLDTRIYWVRQGFYRKHFEHSYRRVCEPLGYNLEDVFYQDAEKHMDVFYLDKAPVIFGMSGTLATMAAPFDPRITERAKTLANDLLSGFEPHVTRLKAF